MPPRPFKPSPLKWLPFGLRRVDGYYISAYVRVFVLILAALAMLVAIGDLFQRFDDFLWLREKDGLGIAEVGALFAAYYAAFVPQLILQYLFPLAMLLAAAIALASSYAGPRGNNEITVLR